MLTTLLQLLALDGLPRTGWLQVGLRDVESVAAHSHGVALMALLLAPEVEPGLDVDRCVALATVHDAPEALLGDLPRSASELLPEGAKRAAEAGAAERLLGPAGTAARDRLDEYTGAASREARFARACDKLHLGLRALGYRRAGSGGLDEFRATLERFDASEFAPVEALKREILAAWDGAAD